MLFSNLYANMYLWIVFGSVCVSVAVISSQKICAKCRYFLYHSNTKYGKCSAFPVSKPVDYASERRRLAELLVTGYAPPVDIQPIDYEYCMVARTDETKCGVDGTRYEHR
jgi:hypothetical protein